MALHGGMCQVCPLASVTAINMHTAAYFHAYGSIPVADGQEGVESPAHWKLLTVASCQTSGDTVHMQHVTMSE